MEKISNKITEEELYVAKLLFHFMSAASTNAIEIGSYMIENQNSWMDGKIITNGVRLNPVVALFNHRSQSFTSLMADLYQDINRVSSFRRCLNGTFSSRKCFIKALVH